jgi:hypothetical protein
MSTLSSRIDAARDQLNRTLTFFGRVDSKASVIFGINAGLLAVLATRAFPYNALRWEIMPIGATLVLLGVSFWHLYAEAFPALDGGENSLLYFREVAKRTEATYIDAWKETTDEQYLSDVLGQVWRNSVILSQKFNHVKWAFNSLALAIVPWLVSLAILSLRTMP